MTPATDAAYMTTPYVLTACTCAALSLLGCEDGDRPRSAANPPAPISAPELRDNRSDAAATDAVEPAPHPTTPSNPAPTSGDAGPGPREEIDNTIYWDAATKPTADHARGIDAGVPDR
jgi:hypothetical protein